MLDAPAPSQPCAARAKALDQCSSAAVLRVLHLHRGLAKEHGGVQGWLVLMVTVPLLTKGTKKDQFHSFNWWNLKVMLLYTYACFSTDIFAGDT